MHIKLVVDCRFADCRLPICRYFFADFADLPIFDFLGKFSAKIGKLSIYYAKFELKFGRIFFKFGRLRRLLLHI
jgi:hypothetical protein